MQSVQVHISHHVWYGKFSYILQLYLLYCKIFYCIFLVWQYLYLIKDRERNTHHPILNIFRKQTRVNVLQLQFFHSKPKPKPLGSKPKPKPCAYDEGHVNGNCLCMESTREYNAIYRINATMQSILNRHRELACKNYTASNLSKHTVNVESLTRSHKTVISHLK